MIETESGKLHSKIKGHVKNMNNLKQNFKNIQFFESTLLCFVIMNISESES